MAPMGVKPMTLVLLAPCSSTVQKKRMCSLPSKVFSLPNDFKNINLHRQKVLVGALWISRLDCHRGTYRSSSLNQFQVWIYLLNSSCPFLLYIQYLVFWSVIPCARQEFWSSAQLPDAQEPELNGCCIHSKCNDSWDIPEVNFDSSVLPSACA